MALVPLPPPVALSRSDLPSLQTGEMYGHRAAHRILATLRTEMGGGKGGTVAKSWVDLTDETRMPWRRYLAWLASAEEVVGDGVVQFLGAFVQANDRNMRQRRFDFIALKADGSGVRLHPSGKTPGVPAFINAVDELPEEALASSSLAWIAHAASLGLGSSQRVLSRRPDGFVSVHQQDVIGRAEAGQFLKDYEARWWARPHPRGPFWREITSAWTEDDGSERFFKWLFYLNSSEELKKLLGRVDLVAVGWQTDVGRPGLYFRTIQKDEFVTDPLGGGKSLKAADQMSRE